MTSEGSRLLSTTDMARKTKTEGPKLKPRKYYEPDFLILALTLLLTLFGLVMVFSASYYYAISKTGNPYTFLINDMMWKLLGWVVFAFLTHFDYHRIAKYSFIVLAVGFVLLGLIFTPLGKTINNATRWLDFKIFTVMPGEVIKTCLILFLAYFYAKDPSRIKRWKDGHFVVLAIGGAAFLLILAQPNLSTAGLVLLLVLGMMLLAGLAWGWIIAMGALGVGAFTIVVLSPKGAYMMERIQTFFDPFKDALGSGYQVVQSLLALGSGGLLGVGLGQSIQKTLYLPEPQSDFILAIIGEELGYVGLIVLMCVYMLLIWRCIKTAIKAPDIYGTLLAGGVALHLGLQVVLNIAVVSASFFPTGVVLPFVSLGGNATILYLAEMGVVFNISRQIRPPEEEGI